ncbi:hypothetical protein Mal33_34150 [Rosistilla oblonga]|uniref:Uncharacterized protein n=1 Tax=Rosistilla oblonga TaxID=2527990 RepID=A0A518IWH7_9BACT|nr:hypothetical protein Mal33_34150 [Rosistilla oblonga]
MPGACAARLYAIAAPRLRRNGNRWLGKTVVRRDSPFAWGLRHQALRDRRSAAENRASAVTRFFKLRSSDRIKPGGASPRIPRRQYVSTCPGIQIAHTDTPTSTPPQPRSGGRIKPGGASPRLPRRQCVSTRPGMQNAHTDTPTSTPPQPRSGGRIKPGGASPRFANRQCASTRRDSQIPHSQARD